MRSTVDVNRLAGGEPGVVADEEQAGRGDFIDGPRTPDGLSSPRVPLYPRYRAVEVTSWLESS
jgi:hypothetical protein